MDISCFFLEISQTFLGEHCPSYAQPSYVSYVPPPHRAPTGRGGGDSVEQMESDETGEEWKAIKFATYDFLWRLPMVP